jgi:hypothetical protein
LWREHGTAQAERIVVRSLAALKLKPEDSRQMRKSNERKILIGALVWKVTTARNGWIAQRSSMGDPTRGEPLLLAGSYGYERRFKTLENNTRTHVFRGEKRVG